MITALHGPILSIVSSAAPITAVLTWSIEDDTSIDPCTRPLWLFKLTSTWPILPVLWSFLSCSPSPRSPSVWPNMAPTTSLRATVPSTLIVACITYFPSFDILFNSFAYRPQTGALPPFSPFRQGGFGWAQGAREWLISNLSGTRGLHECSCLPWMPVFDNT